MQVNNVLKMLNLRENKLGPAGAKHLVGALKVSSVDCVVSLHNAQTRTHINTHTNTHKHKDVVLVSYSCIKLIFICVTPL